VHRRQRKEELQKLQDAVDELGIKKEYYGSQIKLVHLLSMTSFCTFGILTLQILAAVAVCSPPYPLSNIMALSKFQVLHRVRRQRRGADVQGQGKQEKWHVLEEATD
jgi:hypothetical protein